MTVTKVPAPPKVAPRVNLAWSLAAVERQQRRRTRTLVAVTLLAGVLIGAVALQVLVAAFG
jgi:hypothetical protein